MWLFGMGWCSFGGIFRSKRFLTMTSERQTNEMATKKSTTTKHENERAVLVTTVHKGVFFGYATETSGATIKLRAARLAVYWSADLRGFMGLASMGPNKQCKIGFPVDMELRDITAVVECTPQAVENWERGPWA